MKGLAILTLIVLLFFVQPSAGITRNECIQNCYKSHNYLLPSVCVFRSIDAQGRVDGCMNVCEAKCDSINEL
jgi:hypothetical protein